MTLALLLIACDQSKAGDDVLPPLAEQFQQVQVKMEQQADRLTSIEHYLSDKERMRDGVPKGWVLPPVEAYMEVGAPESFLTPVAVYWVPKPVEPVAPDAACPPTDHGKEDPLPIK